MKVRTAIVLAVVLVVPLSVIQWRFPLVALFYLLLPGNLVSLLFTGGHGGTMTQDTIAPFAAAFVNIAAYATVIWLCVAAGSSNR